MLPMIRKYLVAAVSCLVILLAVLFRHPLLEWGVECALNMKYPLDGGWKFHYGDLAFERDRIVFKEITLASKREHAKAEMERLSLVCRKWKGLHVDLAVSIENANARLDQSEGELAFQPSSGGFKVDIDRATVELIDQKGSTIVHGSLISEDRRRTFYLSHAEENSMGVMMKLHEWPEDLIVELEVQDADVAWLSRIFAFFQREKGRGWEITKGRIGGHLWLSTKGQTTANFTLKDLAAVHEQNGLECITQELSFDLSYPSLTLKSKVEGGKLAFKDPRTGIDFALCDLSGSVNFNSFKDSEIELKGHVDHKGQITPILLSGCPSLVDKDTLDIDFKLLLDPESRTITHLDLSIAMEPADQCIIRGRLIDLDIDQIAMFQHMIGFFVPEIRDFQLHTGKVTCEMSLRLQEGRMQKLKLDNLVADNLEIFWKSRDALGFCSRLEGRAQLDILSLSEFQLPTWEVNLQNGDLVVGGGKPFSLSDLSLHLYMCRDVFEPSWVKATYEGIDARLDIVGYYAEADITLGLDTNGERLMALFDKKSPLADYGFHGELEFHRELGYWDVGGHVKMNVRGEWEDALVFSCYLSDRILKDDADLITKLKESVSKGAFRAENISCEFMKFIEAPWAMEGIVSLEGGFDPTSIEGRMKTSYLSVTSPFADVHITTSAEGDFQYDQGKWSGSLPLTRTTIFEKYLKASFHDTDAIVTFDDKEVRLEKIKTEVEGLSLEGEIDFDLHDSFKMKIVTNSVLGTVKQLEKFLSHIKEVSLPFDGKVVSGERGIIFTMDEKIDCEVHMSLVHGSYQLSHLNIQDLAFDFDGSLSDKEALLSSIVGRVGSYSFNGREVHLSLGSENPELFFDVRLENQMMDLVRLAGSLNIKERKLELEKDLTHFFGAKLKRADVRLLASGLPELLAVDFEFPMKDIVLLAKCMNDFELFPAFLDFVGSRALDGLFTGKVECKDDLFTIAMGGKDILFGSEKFHDVKMNAERRDGSWHVRELSLDGYKGEMKWDKNLIVMAKVKAPMGEAEFRGGIVSSKALHLPIERMKIHGVDVTGVLDLAYDRSFLDFVMKGRVGLKSESFGKESIAFATKSDVAIEYSLERGLVVQEAKVDVKKDAAAVSLFIPTLACNLDEKIYQGYRIQAILSPEAIEYLKRDLPTRKDGPTSIVFDFEWSPEKFQIGGLFDEGSYLFRESEYKIDKMSFQYDGRHLDVYLHTPFMGRSFGINLKVLPYDAFEARVEAFDLADPERQALLVDCKLKDSDGISIQRIEGSLFGVDFHLLPVSGMQDEYSMLFMATAKIDAERLGSVLTGELKDLIDELKLGRGYEVQGEFTFIKGDWKKSYFEGFLKGRDFDFLGYQFRTLLSSIRVDSDGTKITEMQVSDNAVSAKIPELKIHLQPDNVWWLNIPEIRIANLRPSLLQRRGQHYHQRLKPFHIKQMVIQDVQGNIADEKSLTGKGHLNFVNTFKKGYNLLDIPIEIISRLGLDMVLLVPIQGEMDYVIKNGKAVFTKLKNSFSESKRSHFYLWNKRESFVDFDGNIHIDIRMKQYVLFKITELFVLSINGTLEQPRFALK